MPSSTVPTFLQKLTCKDLPTALWRIQHNHSGVQIVDGALVAEEPNDIPQNMRQLRKCVIRQLTKEVSSGPDCFLRVFGDYESTLKWAKEWFRLTEGQAESRVQLFKIDPKMLSKSLVFRGADLDQALDVQSDSSARNLLFLDPEEYLVLNRIPDAAISLHAEGCGTLRKQT